MNVLFRSPSGEETENPPTTFLKDILLLKGKDWWSYDAGDVGVFYSSEDGESEMVLALADEQRVLVQHLGFGEDDEWILASSTSATGDVELIIGGEPWRVPDRYLVSREAALSAVIAFCKDGQRHVPPPGTTWEIANYS